jgi:hypothetical protein
MKFAPYQVDTLFVVSESTSSISHELRIYREYGQLVGVISIGDDPDDFFVDYKWYSYKPVVNWVAENWRGFHSDKANVKSILDVPQIDLKYDEE